MTKEDMYLVLFIFLMIVILIEVVKLFQYFRKKKFVKSLVDQLTDEALKNDTIDLIEINKKLLIDKFEEVENDTIDRNYYDGLFLCNRYYIVNGILYREITEGRNDNIISKIFIKTKNEVMFNTANKIYILEEEDNLGTVLDKQSIINGNLYFDDYAIDIIELAIIYDDTLYYDTNKYTESIIIIIPIEDKELFKENFEFDYLYRTCKKVGNCDELEWAIIR